MSAQQLKIGYIRFVLVDFKLSKCKKKYGKSFLHFVLPERAK